MSHDRRYFLYSLLLVDLLSLVKTRVTDSNRPQLVALRDFLCRPFVAHMHARETSYFLSRPVTPARLLRFNVSEMF